MVSSRIVDLPKDDVMDAMLPIPEMMFAAGEEPVRVRVLTYQSSRAINHILNSLEEDEIQTLRMSPFAKAKSKMNKNEQPYWPELFGKAEDLRVSTALKTLRRKTVTEKEVRIKLACLTIVSSVPLATNLKMKIICRGYGFALALQLVMVKAVPALTKVVLETCSSSESDSCDEDDDLTHKKTKKQTLRPDEVLDVKVEYLLKLITQMHFFTAEMFKGGATKLDVKRMHEDKCITAIILSMLKIEVERVDVNVVKAVSLAENTAAKFASFETTVMVSIQNLLNNSKEEVIRSVMQINSSANATTQPARPNVDTTNNAQHKLDIVQPQRDSNDEIIAQVMGNLSQYSTQPHNASVCPVRSDGRTCHTASRLPFVLQTQDPSFDDATLSAKSHTKEATKAQAGQIVHNSSRLSYDIRNIQGPSFSLGLTQAENPPPPGPRCDPKSTIYKLLLRTT
ncbi:unnamed protein product [Brassica oleracea]